MGDGLLGPNKHKKGDIYSRLCAGATVVPNKTVWNKINFAENCDKKEEE